MMMRTEVIHLKAGKVSAAERVSTALLQGEICIIPTDTIYGLVALDEQDAAEKIYRIKERSREKPFIRLIGNIESMKRYTEQELPDELKRFWPGPLTVIFRSRDGGTIALRFPDDPFLNVLFQKLEYRALLAPSANISGKKNILSCSELVETFSGKVSIVVCAHDENRAWKESTIVDISRESLRVVREGAVKLNSR